MALTGVKWKVKIGKDLQYTHIVNHTIREHLLQLLYSGHQSYDYLAGSDNPYQPFPSLEQTLADFSPFRTFWVRFPSFRRTFGCSGSGWVHQHAIRAKAIAAG